MSNAEMLRWPDVRARYSRHVSEDDWRLIRNGLPVRGVRPPATYRGQGVRPRARVLRSELDAYVARVAEWRATFLRADQVSTLLGMPSYGKAINDNHRWKRAHASGQLDQIVTPTPYRFTSMAQPVFWHRDDIWLLGRYYIALGRHQIEQSLAWGWDKEGGLWRPTYPMPLDPEWVPGMTAETVAAARARHRLNESRPRRPLPGTPHPAEPRPAARAFAGA